MQRRDFVIGAPVLAAAGTFVHGATAVRHRSLSVFNHVSLDGYFTDAAGDMSWARNQEPEWLKFKSESAGGEAVLVFGRKTYEMMARFWPTPAAMQAMPEVAEGMNRMRKVVFSRTLTQVTWQNTELVKGDLATETAQLKSEPGPNMVILGSGEIVAQLTQAALIDDYQIVSVPVVLGAGRTLFQGVTGKPWLKLTRTRSFPNGFVASWYSRQ